MPAALSKGMFPIFHTKFEGHTTSVANAPFITIAATLSPILRCFTSFETSIIVPEHSDPGINGKGGFIWYFPSTINISGKFKPAAETEMRICPARIFGDGTSSTFWLLYDLNS